MRIVLCQRDVAIDGSCGGLGTLYANLAKFLASDGAEVTLITATPLEKTGLHQLSEGIVLPFHEGNDLIYCRRVTETLQRLNFDLVETPSWKAELYDYVRLPPNKRRLVVVRAELPATILGLSSRLCKMESLMVKRADSLIAVSRAVAEAMYATYQRHIHVVVANGVDLDIFSPPKSQTVDNLNRVVWVGNFLKVKRLNWLIEIIKQSPTLMFDVVIPEHPNHDLTHELRILHNVIIYHSVTQTTLANLFSQAAVTISTSSFEAFGLTLLESMACGTPILIPSTLRSTDDFFQNGLSGLVYSSPDEAAYLLQNTNWSKMRTDVALQARNFSWQGCGQATSNMYQSILSHREE